MSSFIGIGSKWWKFDFHTHTPTSDDYGRGDDSLKTIEPEEWLRKAMESGLDCVVVTDHNAGGWIDVLKTKNKELKELDLKPSWYKELTIFPGVEITVANSSSRIHLLAVFDPNCDSQKVTGVLGSCGITSGYGEGQNTSTTTGFVDTVRKITEASGVAIAAHIDGSKGLLEVSTLEDEYRSLLNLEDGKFVSSVCDRENEQGLLWTLNKWEEAEKSESDLPQLISQIKAKTLDIARGQVSGNHGAFDNRLKKLLETQPTLFDQLDAWWPEDMLRVKYSKDPSSGKFDDLEKGSAGQKAAAILAFLLSHGNGPLIIDQPEDDLDNALIYDLIVKQIHENKNRRQLIIVTHNPNIVVNGDSELVHVLKFDGGQVQIDQQGGLQESSIRESICTIMEGGRQAFEKRYNRITLTSNQW